MFEDLAISSYKGEYHVDFGSWDLFLPSVLRRGDVVLIDRKVAEIFSELSAVIADFNIIQVDATEETKSYEGVGSIIQELASIGFSRNNRLVAVGGGVTQDVTSFVASILFRGVDWIFFPTNLASQCDSCIGSKTSLNFREYKNQLGGFYPPRHIYIDFRFCSSLNAADVCAGLGEMMHYFLVDGSHSLDDLHSEVTRAQQDSEVLFELIHRSLSIKKSMVEIDEFDVGPRRVFNYGHTFGHAIETSSGFTVPHGIGVAYGMDLANIVSVELGHVTMDFRNRVRLILQDIFFPIPLPKFDMDLYFAALLRDKKNVDGVVNVILTRGKGDMFQTPLVMDSRIKKLISDFFMARLYERNL